MNFVNSYENIIISKIKMAEYGLFHLHIYGKIV